MNSPHVAGTVDAGGVQHADVRGPDGVNNPNDAVSRAALCVGDYRDVRFLQQSGQGTIACR